MQEGFFDRLTAARQAGRFARNDRGLVNLLILQQALFMILIARIADLTHQRYRKVTIWTQVQKALGEKVVSIALQMP